ncbi:MAG: diacylglycerol kinase [Pirellulales bacterium]
MANTGRGFAAWRRKFGPALRGLAVGIRSESSFPVHFFAAVVVLVASGALGMRVAEWATLLLSITIVMMAELFNSALERMARAVSKDHDPHLADALDTSSGAVLVAAIGAAAVGTLVFLNRLLEVVC